MTALKPTKFFWIQSQLNELVLDVQEASKEPATAVITYERTEGADHQLWYEDPFTGTIRTKLNAFCLDIDDEETLVVNPYEAGKESQMWTFMGTRLHTSVNPLRVADIEDANDEPGARVCVFDYNGEDNQKWDPVYSLPEPFYIVSELNKFVLDVADVNMEPGGKVIMYSKHSEPTANQLWYEDNKGNIRSCLTHFILDISKSPIIRCHPYEHANMGQHWLIKENQIVNKGNPSKCIEIKKKNKKKKAELCQGDFKKQKHQLWKFEYPKLDILALRGDLGQSEGEEEDDFADSDE